MSLAVAANSKRYEMKAKWRTLFEVILIVLIIVFAFNHEEQQNEINDLHTEINQLKLGTYLELYRQDSIKYFIVIDGTHNVGSPNSILSSIKNKPLLRVELLEGEVVKSLYGEKLGQIAIYIETKKESEIDSLSFY